MCRFSAADEGRASFCANAKAAARLGGLSRAAPSHFAADGCVAFAPELCRMQLWSASSSRPQFLGLCPQIGVSIEPSLARDGGAHGSQYAAFDHNPTDHPLRSEHAPGPHLARLRGATPPFTARTKIRFVVADVIKQRTHERRYEWGTILLQTFRTSPTAVGASLRNMLYARSSPYCAVQWRDSLGALDLPPAVLWIV